MARRTLQDVRIETMIAERGGMLRHVERHRAAVEAAVKRGRLDRESGDAVNRQIVAFAEACAIGLHVDGDTPNAVRDALRPLVKAVTE